MDQHSPGIDIRSPLHTLRMAVPAAVRVDGDTVRWTLDDGWGDGGSADGALAAFLDLGNESGGDVAAFVRRWGVFGTLPDGALCLRRGGTFPPHKSGPDGTLWFCEDVAHWRAYARLARAILAIAAALRDAGRRIDPATVLGRAGLLPPGDGPEPLWMHERGVSMQSLAYNLTRAFRPIGPSQDKTLDEQRLWLGGFLSSFWLAPAGVLPVVTWDGSGPAFGLSLDQYTGMGPGVAWGSFGVAPLFTVVAVQLAARVCSRDRLTVCERCGLAYVAEHPRQRYCEGCRSTANREANTAKQRRWRQRKQAQSLSQLPPQKIPQRRGTAMDGGGR